MFREFHVFEIDCIDCHWCLADDIELQPCFIDFDDVPWFSIEIIIIIAIVIIVARLIIMIVRLVIVLFINSKKNTTGNIPKMIDITNISIIY